MTTIKNWNQKTKKRLELLWDNDLLDRCVVNVQAPLDAADPYVEEVPTDPKTLKQWYLDPEWILERNLEKISKTYYAGDAFPTVFPYFGTGGHCKYLCGEDVIEYTPDSIWIHPAISDYDRFDYKLEKDNAVLVRELKALEFLAKEGMGKFMVGPPDNCGNFDALSELRGNVELLMDLIMNPEAVAKGTDGVADVLIESGNMVFDQIRKNNDGGSVHAWMNTWSPGKHMQLQCDASVMMSNQDFEKFIVPELIKSADWLDNAIYHFDGAEQVRHIDSLMKIEGINMIQWVQVAGQPPVTEYIPELKRIQAAGRGLVLQCGKTQIEPLLSQLSPKGIILNVKDAVDKEEADRIVRFVENFSYRPEQL